MNRAFRPVFLAEALPWIAGIPAGEGLACKRRTFFSPRPGVFLKHAGSFSAKHTILSTSWSIAFLRSPLAPKGVSAHGKSYSHSFQARRHPFRE